MLGDLPADVLHLILARLDLHEIIIFRAVCRRFDDVIANRFADEIDPVEQKIRAGYENADWYSQVKLKWSEETPIPTRHEVMAAVALCFAYKVFPFGIEALDDPRDIVGLIYGLHDNLRYTCVNGGIKDKIPRWYIHKYSQWFYCPI